MKNLKGMKKSLSSLENKKLQDLGKIQGGLYFIRSNFACPSQYPSEAVEYDTYESNGGKYIGRTCQQAASGTDIGNANGTC
ncbi:TIGR04139 family peptide modification target [Pedobacter riviphilus]|uniref:TIGR04139 family peptide modification target n=1 Tax=Pedobacter riviphilus TaxID=2766984 RepID=A0ABX6TI66_9SPHI|nr:MULTISPECIES: TIGR04139 family peptide modification target [Pedobacter]NII84269.1 putative peptide modification target (TIGR04139 family) [Pedobacter sp. SG908]NMN38816.1 putative peptide modification target (TIGR04139 family) [Pedobacter sp. SG918]QNR84095.1 TIGR04139 family peptide modification target [Pedobacter riviphilus]